MKAESTPRTQMTSLTRASVPSSSDPVTGKSEVAEPGTSATRSSSLSTTSPPSEVLPRQPTLRCLSDEIVQSDEGQPERNSSRKHNSPLRPTLTACSLPRRVLDCKYAVRGPTVRRALEVQKRLKESPGSFPFSRLIFANTGDPQGLGQPPISFYRQIMACVMYPPLMGLPLKWNKICTENGLAVANGLGNHCAFPHLAPEEQAIYAASQTVFPSDVLEQGRRYISGMRTIGSYTHSQGLPLFREIIARWLEERDGVPTNPDHIFLTDGASAGIRLAMELLLRGPDDGLLIPVPQYPLYAGLIIRGGGRAIPYFLEEETGWSLSADAMTTALQKARSKGVAVRAVVVINPGNPTGTVLTEAQIQDILRFCEAERLVLLADEVYQDNVYVDIPFTSVRKVMHKIGANVTVFSFHSSSKGLVGECGTRGGMMHVDAVEAEVVQQMYKLVSMFMCANILGQVAITNVCCPPKPNGPSYERFQRERQEIYDSMKTKANLVHDRLNQIEGISCQAIAGSVFGFPRIEIPTLAAKKASEKGMEPDLLFCLELLEETGIVTVPGSGFGQKSGTYHVRICILPSYELLADMLERFEDFYKRFVERYST